MSCSEFAHFTDQTLNDQHHELLATIDTLIRQLEKHDLYEHNLVVLSNMSFESEQDHWKKHDQTLEFVRKLRAGLIAHINNDDTRLFNRLKT